ncbi:hypothetical protein RvY_02873 [Ramazzottius varieornatus]|uniref:Uncharacterized protein n=1 Tax=Ramazzottius varieornatus TaxID=947166 RepID=A0A1D1URX4_RAMVA|nr:hypothetical protein RvY_02873 [Ramazzottius varieornatus]
MLLEMFELDASTDVDCDGAIDCLFRHWLKGNVEEQEKDQWTKKQSTVWPPVSGSIFDSSSHKQQSSLGSTFMSSQETETVTKTSFVEFGQQTPPSTLCKNISLDILS